MYRFAIATKNPPSTGRKSPPPARQFSAPKNRRYAKPEQKHLWARLSERIYRLYALVVRARWPYSLLSAWEIPTTREEGIRNPRAVITYPVYHQTKDSTKTRQDFPLRCTLLTEVLKNYFSQSSLLKVSHLFVVRGALAS